jgi:hypothetical protein
MKRNKIGILELRNDPFMADVISRLGDFPVEFLSFTDQPVPVSSEYKVVVDRLSYCYPYLNEMAKTMSLDGTYVINNPFAASVNNKLVEATVCQSLGIPFPKSIVLPDPVLCEETVDLVSEPCWERAGDEVGFPCILKPIDGYGWESVYVIDTLADLRERYAAVGSGRTWLLQQKVHYDLYYRIFCIDKRDILFVRWNPKPFDLGEYLYTDLKEIGSVREKLTEQIIQLNSYLDLDINAVEWCIDNNGQAWVVDAFNEVPDVPEEHLPHEYYWWIVDRFASCILDKLDPGKRNKSIFDLLLPQSSM